MIEEIFFKDQDITVDILMNIIRYKNVNSESGAYIFAPSEPAVDLSLRPLEIILIKS